METENMPKWQRGLTQVEILEGEPFTPGAKSRLVFDTGKKTLIMTETLTDMRLPDTYTATYETDEVWNRCSHVFSEIEGGTLWTMENEFVFTGFMRFLGPLLKRSFMRRTELEMLRFRNFVETHDQLETPAETETSGGAAELKPSAEQKSLQE